MSGSQDEAMKAALQEKTLAMNEALLLGAVRQHELTEEAERLNAQLHTEIAERKQGELELTALRDQLAAELEAMNRLHQLATCFLQQEDPHTLFEAILDAAIAITGANKGYVQLLDPASGQPGIMVQRGFDSAFVEFFGQIGAGSVACGTAMQTRHCVIVEDLTLSPLFLAEPRALELELAAGMRAVVCTPLLTLPGQLLGVLSVHFSAPHRLNERDLRLLDLLARQAADFIERTRIEEAQARLAAIVEWSDDAILSKALDGTIRTWNAGAQRMFGYRAEEVIGQAVTVLVPPERIEEENRILEQLKRGEPIQHFETVRLAKDGRRLDVSLTISPMKDSRGRVIGASKIVRDIGELVQARQVLTQSKADLERLVDERTAKLRGALGDLEHMSYSMVHDMRAPLRAMQSFAMLLEEQCAGCSRAPGLDYLRRIRESASRLDRLVIDALNYSQVVSQELPVTPVEVGGLLRGMIESYPDLQPAAAEITIEFHGLAVLGNESLLTQCFGNLLGNAVKFIAPGVKPQIRIWAEGGSRRQGDTETRSGGTVRIWVEDNGIGIPKDAQEKIFRMFQRMHRESEYPGNGIGLAIVRKAVERMGGHLGLQSEPGQGSKFWIELPDASEAENRERREKGA